MTMSPRRRRWSVPSFRAFCHNFGCKHPTERKGRALPRVDASVVELGDTPTGFPFYAVTLPGQPNASEDSEVVRIDVDGPASLLLAYDSSYVIIAAQQAPMGVRTKRPLELRTEKDDARLSACTPALSTHTNALGNMGINEYYNSA